MAMRDPPYLPIEDYGLVGNLEPCVLVGHDGSVDRFRFPFPVVLQSLLTSVRRRMHHPGIEPYSLPSVAP